MFRKRVGPISSEDDQKGIVKYYFGSTDQTMLLMLSTFMEQDKFGF